MILRRVCVVGFLGLVTLGLLAEPATGQPANSTQWVDWEIQIAIENLQDGGSLRCWFPIPPSGSYQQLGESSFSKPQEAYLLDPIYGNEIAYFTIDPDDTERLVERIEISILNKQWAIDEDGIEQYDALDPEYELYLSSTENVQSSHPEIQDVANQLVGNEENPLRVVREILLFVTRHGIRGDRPNFDALSALRSRRGQCGAHVALFTAIARAAGVPTRPVSGIDVLRTGTATDGPVNGYHMWAEVLLPPYGWIPVDPTSGMFGHILGDRIVMSRGSDFHLPSDGPVASWFHMPVVLPEGQPEEWYGQVSANDFQRMDLLAVRKLGVRPATED